MTTTSVALCTYNGARFLGEQLQSIARQTRAPDELVVCDDGSTDGTLSVLEEFTASARFPVRIYRNSQRLGVTGNFSQAISLCTGSIILLADQDDVWVPRKLAVQSSILETRSAVGAVFSDAEVVDEALRPAGRSMFQVTGFSSRRQRRLRNGDALDVLLARSVVCGATLAFRSSFRHVLLPIPPSGLHDVWLATMLSALTQMVALSEPLIRYRQHFGNQVGATPRSPLAKLSRRRTQGIFGDEVAHYDAMAERLFRQADGLGADEMHAVAALRKKTAHLEFRYGTPPPSFGAILAELARGGYHRYSRGLESAAYDLLLRRRAPSARLTQ